MNEGLAITQLEERRPHKEDDERSDFSHDLYKGDQSEKNTDLMSEFDKNMEDS